MVTLLYCTANKEEFEGAIIKNIKDFCPFPIVSVSQKPLDFGENICVGDIGHSYFSQFRQIQIGLRAIETPFVLVAEADTLYSPDYYNIPEDKKNCQRYDNVWILYNNGRKFFFKRQSHCAQLVNKDAWLERIDYLMEKGWDSVRVNNRTGKQLHAKYSDGWTGAPIISLKTKNAVTRKTWVKRDVEPVNKLPYWGTVKNVLTLLTHD